MKDRIIQMSVFLMLAPGVFAQNVPQAEEAKDAKEDPSAQRFIDNGDGTVTDTKFGLMWASQDNGKDTNWADAKAHCETFRAGGHTDWRMPTIQELSSLFDEHHTKKSRVRGIIV